MANNPYMDYGTWEEAVIAYHVETNDITNTFLEQLSTVKILMLAFLVHLMDVPAAMFPPIV